MIPAVLALCLALPRPADGDVRAWLDRLRADTSAERSLAQRWLGRHIAVEDLELLRRAAVEGDAEVRRRLALALADDDRHVEIASALAVSSEAPAAAVGRAALVESIARSSPGWTERGLAVDDLLAKLAGHLDRLVAVDPRTEPGPRTEEGRLDLALEELLRLVPGAPQLVLDPDLALADPAREPPIPPSGEIEGTFGQVLRELVSVHRADCEGFDFPDAEDAPARPWIRIGRAAPSTRRSAALHVALWCEDLLRAADPTRRSACARAIAATGWPAGLAWMERRWRIRSDEAALDGVLLAAGRGLVAPSLLEPEVRRALHGAMGRAVAGEHADLARADAIARALALSGPRGPLGLDLAAIAVEGLQAGSPREQWLRLVVVEGLHAASPEAARAIDALLAAPGVPRPVAFQALRARSTIRSEGSGPPPVRDAAAILAWADSVGRAEECAGLFASLGVAPASPIDPLPSPGRSASRSLAELEWIVSCGDASAASRKILALAAPDGLGLEALAERTRAWVLRGNGDRLEAAILAARSIDGADADRLDRLELLSGAGSPDLRARLLAATSSPSSREDLLCLAALTAGPGGGDAVRALVRSVGTHAPPDDVIAALGLALAFLRAARDDLAERDLIQSVRRVAREGPPELRVRFGVDAWPGRERREVVRGQESDRSLSSSSLP